MQTFYFSTIYTTIPRENLNKNCLKENIHGAFYFKNDNQHYKLIVLVHELTYFVKHECKGKRCYTEKEVIGMLEFFLSITYFRLFHICQQIKGINMGTNGAPLLVDISHYSY
jgi:hypothetical protein